LCGKSLTVKHVLQANSAAGNLVFVGRTDATACGADFTQAFGFFSRLVDGNVVRQD
jgi:hypothetical protein